MKTALPSRVALAGLLVLAAVALAGCTEVPVKNYIEPVGGDAEACLEVCRAERFSCRTEAQREAEGCQQRYDYRYERWRQCVLTRGERRCAGIKPYPCPSPAYQPCSDAWDRCFVGCGGRIE